jgi:hypothetical protein
MPYAEERISIAENTFITHMQLTGKEFNFFFEHHTARKTISQSHGGKRLKRKEKH